LIVNVKANTAELSGPLGAARKDLGEFGEAAKGAGQATSFSMLEARGSLMLMERELGFGMPREINRLIATLPGIGTAMEALLPVMAGVFAAKKMYDFYEKWEKANAELTLGEKALYSEATKGAEKLLKAQEAGIKAEYELQIAQAAGDPAKQAALRLAEMRAIGEAQGHNLAGLVATGAQIRQQIADEEKLMADKIAASEVGGSTGFESVVDTSAQEGRIKALKAELQENADLQEAARNREKSNQAQQITDAYRFGEVKTGIARKAAEEARKFEEEGQKAQAKHDELMARARYAAGEVAEKSAAEDRRILEYKLSSEMQLEVEAEKKHEELLKMAEAEDFKHASTMAELSAKEGHLNASREKARYQEMYKALEDERRLLTSSGEKRILDEKKIDDREEEEAKKHQNKMDAITRQGEEQRAAVVKQFANMTLFQNQSVAQAVEQIAKQSLQTLIDRTIQGLIVKKDAEAQEKIGDARTAAANTYSTISAIPFIGPFIAPPMAAAAFAGVMAFEGGGEIPGAGPVPILGHGGETVVTKTLTDQVKANAGGGGHTFNFAPVVHATDSEGVDRMLKKHSDVFAKHITSELRKMHKRG
jgi:hypothetical protein